MKLRIVTGLLLSLGCISAADAPANYMSYYGVQADKDPYVAAAFYRARQRCEPEASSYGRGAPEENSVAHVLAMRACMARYDFVDRGAYAFHPAGVWYKHIFDH